MGLWVAPNGDPHPEGTACASRPPGPIEVNIRIPSIKVLYERDFNDRQSQLNFVFTLFTDNFRRSVRTQTSVVSVESGELVSSVALPSGLCLSIDPSEQIIATIQGWDDNEATEGRQGGSRGELDRARFNHRVQDHILTGVTLPPIRGSDLDAGMGVGTFRRESDNPNNQDLEVAFEVSVGRIDTDGDGLSLCEELSAVWVDFAFTRSENGTAAMPFNTLAEGVDAVSPLRSRIFIKPGTSSETIKITEPLTLQAAGGSVVIGR